MLAPASAHAQGIDGYPLDVTVDGRGGLQVDFDGRSNSEFAPGAGLEIRIGDTASPASDPARTPLAGPTHDEPSPGVQRLTSRYGVASLEVTERVTTVDGTPSVRLEYEIRNPGQAAVAVNAAEIADIVSPFDGQATGVHTDGQPEFAGSLDRLGRSVGLEEVTNWDRYEVDAPGALRDHFRAGAGLDNVATSGFFDAAVGAQWNLTIPAGGMTPIAVIWRFDFYESELRVNTTHDHNDGACTDADCTLREAFRYAEDDTAIRLPAGVYRIVRQLESDEDVVLIGEGARTTVIDGGSETRLLEVEDDQLDVYGVRFTRGNGEHNDEARSAFALTASVGNGRGGAIAVQPGAALYLNDSAVVNNRARLGGGGIASEGEVELTSSVVSGNEVTSAGANGGGISATTVDSNDPFALDVRNSTISGNRAPQGAGGGIYATAPLFLRHATIADNQAAAGTGGGIHRLGPESVRAVNSLLDGNTPMACGGDPGERSTSNNLVDDVSCGITGFGDVQGVDARIGPLADNGGPTDTHALAPDSPAVDTADGHDCISPDQRGEPRYQGLGCDKGAYELRAEPFEDTGRIDGRPLDIAADGLGRLQLRFNDEVEGAFSDRLDDIGAAGLAFLSGGVYYPAGGPDVQGPQLGRRTPISGPTASITGAGGRRLASSYFVGGNLRVDETVTYLDGTGTVGLRYAIRNISSAPVSFRAGELAMVAEIGVGEASSGMVGIRDPQGGVIRLRQGATPWRAVQASQAFTDTDVYQRFGGTGLSGEVDDESAEQLGAEWEVEGLAPGAERVIEVSWELAPATREITVIQGDENDDSCDPGDCSLREALGHAPSGSVIRLPAGEYQLTHGELVSERDFVVRGAGAGQTVIKAAPDSRVLRVQTGTLGLSGVRITGGDWDEDEYGGGGGIFVYNDAWLALADSRVDHNSAVGDGGGILAFGRLSAVRSTIDSNDSLRGPDGQSYLGGGGGGILSMYQGQTRLVNVTVSGNRAATAGGGVVSLGTARLTNVTVADNTAPAAAGVYHIARDRRQKAAAAAFDYFGTDLRGVLVAGNHGPACASDDGVRARSTIADDSSCDFAEIVADARVAPLAGGTHALLADSPALDAMASGGDCPTSDQNWLARPVGGACDVGAYERPGAVAPTITSPVEGALLATSRVTVSGTAGEGDSVEVFVDSQSRGEAPVGSDRQWSLTLDLADGEHVLTARTAASGFSDPRRITVDTRRPDAPVVTGASDATTVTLSGQAEPGAVVTVYEGEAPVGETTADAGGTWTLTLTGVTSGDHAYTAVARDGAGNVSSRSGAFTVTVATPTPPAPAPPQPTPTPTATPEQLPPPVVAQSVNVAPKSGTVRVRVRGSNRFVELEAGRQIPVGSTVDTTKGRITLTSAAGGGTTQTADFYDGIFRIGQTRGARPVTELTLVEELSCPRSRASAAAKKKSRKLWGSGRGNFRTVGSYSSATVRGTVWLTQDRCDRTVTKVRTGTVAVRDNVKRKTVVVKAGRTYTARAKRR